jgi:hypothetical protein
MDTTKITAAIKGMETVRLTIRELIFALMIVLNGPIVARTYEDRMKIARRLECSDRTVRKVLFNLRRAGILRKDATRIYWKNGDTGYADEMLKHVMDCGAYFGLCALFRALENRFPSNVELARMRYRTEAEQPTYAKDWCLAESLNYLVSLGNNYGKTGPRSQNN